MANPDGVKSGSVFQVTHLELSGDIEAVLFAGRRLAIRPHPRQNNLVKPVLQKMGRKPYSYNVATETILDMQTGNLELLIAPNSTDYCLVAWTLLFLDP